jgi:hypothetical protein
MLALGSGRVGKPEILFSTSRVEMAVTGAILFGAVPEWDKRTRQFWSVSATAL